MSVSHPGQSSWAIILGNARALWSEALHLEVLGLGSDPELSNARALWSEALQ